MRRERAPRLIDLQIPWLWQYAPETELFDPALSASIPPRLGQVDGYMQTAWAAVLAIGPSPGDGSRRPDPWADLGEQLTRVEAEFAGRLLIGPDDHARW